MGQVFSNNILDNVGKQSKGCLSYFVCTCRTIHKFDFWHGCFAYWTWFDLTLAYIENCLLTSQFQIEFCNFTMWENWKPYTNFTKSAISGFPTKSAIVWGISMPFLSNIPILEKKLNLWSTADGNGTTSFWFTVAAFFNARERSIRLKIMLLRSPILLRLLVGWNEIK